MDRPPQVGFSVTIRPAVWPADELVAVSLLQHYAEYLATAPGGAVEICLSSYADELATLSRRWSGQRGVLLLAFLGEQPAGCVAVKVRGDRDATSEMKRLWVEPDAQGRGLGRQLAQAAIAWARARGVRTLLLDTVPASMPQAVALYRSLGFTRAERHNGSEIPGLHFMQLDLE